jgi:hypothetical protein
MHAFIFADQPRPGVFVLVLAPLEGLGRGTHTTDASIDRRPHSGEITFRKFRCYFRGSVNKVTFFCRSILHLFRRTRATVRLNRRSLLRLPLPLRIAVNEVCILF